LETCQHVYFIGFQKKKHCLVWFVSLSDYLRRHIIMTSNKIADLFG